MKTKPTRLDAYQLIHDGILALGRAEQTGMCIDVAYCERKKQHLTRKIKYFENKLLETEFVKEWKRLYGNKFNMNSDTQLGRMLYKVLKITPSKTTPSGAGATDEEALQQIGMSELDMILQIRKLAKVRDTYLDAFHREQVDGVLHPFFNLHTVVTYRSSCNSPNFQNIPKRDKESMKLCRRAILPRKGHQLLEVDFSGLEVFVAACYHKDPTMMRYLTDDHADMHGDMTEQIFKLEPFSKSLPEHAFLRSATKNGFVFPQFYGDYYGNNAYHLAVRWGKLPKSRWKKGIGVPMPGGSFLSDHLISKGIKSYDAFTEHIKDIEKDFWTNRFFMYQKWKDRWFSRYQKRGYVDMLTGFRCSGLMRRNEVINYPVQGAAFHCLLWSFIQVDKAIQAKKLQSRLIGQIHDAMVLDVHPAELDEIGAIIKKTTCHDLLKHWPWIILPLDVEAEICAVDAPWSEKGKHELPEVCYG